MWTAYTYHARNFGSCATLLNRDLKKSHVNHAVVNPNIIYINFVSFQVYLRKLKTWTNRQTDDPKSIKILTALKSVINENFYFKVVKMSNK